MNEELTNVIRRLDERTEPSPLSPKQPRDRALDADIASLVLVEPEDRRTIALMCALYLRNDSIELAHGYAQQIEYDATGAYWHGIIHRMEQDYSNAKYWLYESGRHPASMKLQQRAQQWLREESRREAAAESKVKAAIGKLAEGAAWNALAFIDAIVLQENGRGSAETDRILRQLQAIEMDALFDETLEAFLQI